MSWSPSHFSWKCTQERWRCRWSQLVLSGAACSPRAACSTSAACWPRAARGPPSGTAGSGGRYSCLLDDINLLRSELNLRVIATSAQIETFNPAFTPGKGPFHGVVDIMGAGGGLMEQRAALLASRGFAVMCMAFFAYEDLPKSIQTLFEIAYFQEAVQCLLSRDEVCSDGVGVIASSKGGEFALNMAISMPQVKATIIVNSSILALGSPTKLLDGSQRPLATVDFEKVMLYPGGVMNMYYTYENLSQPESIIPVEEAHGDILWLCSLEDLCSNSARIADVAVERCEKAGKPGKVKAEKFAGAGHLLEPPNIPFCHTARNKVFQIDVAWGGRANEHCAAQEKAWKKLLPFLGKNCSKLCWFDNN